MKKTTFIILISLTVFFLASCGGGGKVAKPSGARKVYYPEWFGLQGDPESVFSYGQATKKSQNMSYNSAQSNAYLEAAQYVESHVKALVKDYEAESGVDNPQITALTSKVIKNVSNAKFTGGMVTKRETIELENGKFQTFVQLKIPKDTVNKMMVDNIRNEEALYNEFKASQSFKELDEELNK